MATKASRILLGKGSSTSAASRAGGRELLGAGTSTGPVLAPYWPRSSLDASPPHLEASSSIVWPPCLFVLPPPSLALSPLPRKDLIIANDGAASFLMMGCSEWHFGNVTEGGFLRNQRNRSWSLPRNMQGPKLCRRPTAGDTSGPGPSRILAINGANNHDFGHHGGGAGLPRQCSLRPWLPTRFSPAFSC